MPLFVLALLLGCKQPCQLAEGDYTVSFEGDLDGTGEFDFYFSRGWFGEPQWSLRADVWMEPPEGDRIYEPRADDPAEFDLLGQDCDDRSLETESRNYADWSRNPDSPDFEGYRIYVEGLWRGSRRLGGTWIVEHIVRVDGTDDVLGVFEGTFSGSKS